MGSSEFIGAVEEHVEQVVERCSSGEGLLLADGLDLGRGNHWCGKEICFLIWPASRIFCGH